MRYSTLDRDEVIVGMGYSIRASDVGILRIKF